MPPQRPVSDLAVQLEELASAVARLEVAPPGSGQDPKAERDRVVRTIRSYLVPRIREPLHPLLVVFAGPTGAGKSTLLNSVAGLELSRTGSLRPTTKTPVVFAAEGRTRGYSRIGGVSCRVVSGKARILGDLTLVDTPDIDSTARDHREQAEILIDNADVVVFVTSAIRYADLVPWETLRRAQSRGAPILPVLNRIRSTSEGALGDFRRLLEHERLDQDLVAVPEHHMASGRQMVPAVAIKGLRSRLISLVDDHNTKRSDTVTTVLRTTVGQAGDVVKHAQRRAEEVGVWNSRLDTMLSPDLDRLAVSIGDHPARLMDLEALMSIEKTRRRRVRRFLSRHGPSPAQVSEAVRRVGNLLTASVEADLRRGVTDLASGWALPITPRIDHRAISGAVHDWLASVEESVKGMRSPFRDSGFLLLTAYALDERSVWGDALEVVAPSLNIYALRTGARWRLRGELSPIYESLRLLLRQSLGARASSNEEIQSARTAVAALTPRKSLTYA